MLAVDELSSIRSRRLFVEYPNAAAFRITHTVLPVRLEGKLSVEGTVKMTEQNNFITI
jgi:hypothetical protein